ncbi:hypothetical protein [Chryseobacterium gossypii]|uniref:hypothetical protein n=1 Tax=Chryseobacterium gossypii TaxID=3231602 RepID=UPI00352610AC
MKKNLFSIAMLALVTGTVYGQVGINTTNPQGIFNVDGAKNNSSSGIPSADELKDDFIVTSDGSTGIGATPDASAILELNVNNLSNGSKKGFLGPRVALTSFDDATTIPSPATGLLVYNLGTESTFAYKGYVYWDGTQWKQFDGRSLQPGSINSLACTGASLEPNTYSQGVPYQGNLTIPYSGGNGGVFPDQTIGPINGLTATLVGGNLAMGGGELIYSVSGTPLASSPATTTFPINIGGQSCNIVVGAGKTLQPGEFQFFHYEIPASYTGLLSNSPAGGAIIMGKIRIDAMFTASSNAGPGTYPYQPRLYNATSENIKLWFGAVSNVTNYMGGNILLAPGGYAATDDGIYCNWGYNDNSSTTPRTAVTGSSAANETETIDFVVDGIWYRMTIFIVVDNKNNSNDSDNTRIINIVAQRMSGY